MIHFASKEVFSVRVRETDVSRKFRFRVFLLLLLFLGVLKSFSKGKRKVLRFRESDIDQAIGRMITLE